MAARRVPRGQSIVVISQLAREKGEADEQVKDSYGRIVTILGQVPSHFQAC
jgi:hypothetical protein